MDIFVYDNIDTYYKRNPNRSDKNMEIEVYKTAVTKNRGFWYFSHMNKEEAGLNINKPYVHFHDGLKSFNQLQLDEPPTFVTKKQWKYNPKTGFIEARTGWFPWSKPKFWKKATYYGIELPQKKMSCLGVWYYDLKFERINVILDYYPLRKTVYEMDEKPDVEALQKRLDNIKLYITDPL